MRPCDSRRIGVVGAGPAGSYLAWQLAKAGMGVDIYDPSHPREKPCGGVLSAETLAYLPEASQLASANLLRQLAFRTPAGRRFQVEQPRQSVAVNRKEFDHWLLEKAVAAGARHIPERVRSVQFHAAQGHLTTPQRTEAYDLVCAADGVRSVVARAVGLQLPSEKLGFTTGGWGPVTGPPGTVAVWFGKHLGYAWIINRADIASIGIGGPMHQRDELIATFEAFLKAHGIERQELEPYRWVIPFSDDPSFLALPRCGPNWLAVGDAAGFCDPLTGEGIHLAIASAHEAATAVREGNHLSYDERWRHSLGPNLRFGMTNRNLLASMPMAESLLSVLERNPAMGMSFFKFL